MPFPPLIWNAWQGNRSMNKQPWVTEHIIDLWRPTANIPNLHCALLAATPAIHNPDKYNKNADGSVIPLVTIASQLYSWPDPQGSGCTAYRLWCLLHNEPGHPFSPPCPPTPRPPWQAITDTFTIIPLLYAHGHRSILCPPPPPPPPPPHTPCCTTTTHPLHAVLHE